MSELADIESNFDTNEWIKDTGFAQCDDHGASTSLGDEGKLRFECEMSHLSYDDPIVYPNQPGAAHLHHFFGNTLTNAYSSFGSLRTSGDGTCAGGPINRTGYWFPAMIRPQNNKVVKPDGVTVYYQINRYDVLQRENADPTTYPQLSTQYAAQDMPRGLVMIFGWQASDGSTPYGVWGCVGGVAGPGRLESHLTLQDLADDGACPGGSQVIARIISADCWDGVNLDSVDHRSHLAFPTQTATQAAFCPSTHPYKIPQITIQPYYSNNGPSDFAQWYISSDDGHGAPDATYAGGTTFHTDWFGAWDQPWMEFWAEHVCGIGTGAGAGTVKTSVVGGICEDPDYELILTNELTAGIISTATIGEPDRYADIPQVPSTVVLLGQACM
jgi:hypothetical protein